MDLLNIKPNVVSKNLRGFSFLFFGVPKIGKSTLAHAFPKSLFLSTETGQRLIPGAMIQECFSWAVFKQFIMELEKEEIKEAFQTIIIDTADLLYDLCEKYICNREGVSKINEIPFGGGYKLCENEFDKTVRRIQELGYTLILISHSKVSGADEDNGKLIPTLSKKALNSCSKLSDFIGCLTKVNQYKDPEKPELGVEEKRIILFKDSPEAMAGARLKYIAPYCEVSYEALVETIHKAIDDEAKETGLAPTNEEKKVETVVKESFSTVKQQAMELITDLITKSPEKQEEIQGVLSEVLGIGKKLSDTQAHQQELVELIIAKVQGLS